MQVASRFCIDTRQSSNLDFDCRRLLCNALVQPYLDYCSTAWYSSLTVELKRRLDVIQRRMTRFIFSLDRLSHIDETDLRKLSWLSIPDRVRFFKLTQVFKIRNGISPQYLAASFLPLSEAHGYETRRKSFNYQISRELSNSRSSFTYTSMGPSHLHIPMQNAFLV